MKERMSQRIKLRSSTNARHLLPFIMRLERVIASPGFRFLCQDIRYHPVGVAFDNPRNNEKQTPEYNKKILQEHGLYNPSVSSFKTVSDLFQFRRLSAVFRKEPLTAYDNRIQKKDRNNCRDRDEDKQYRNNAGGNRRFLSVIQLIQICQQRIKVFISRKDIEK